MIQLYKINVIYNTYYIYKKLNHFVVHLKLLITQYCKSTTLTAHEGRLERKPEKSDSWTRKPRSSAASLCSPPGVPEPWHAARCALRTVAEMCAQLQAHPLHVQIFHARLWAAYTLKKTRMHRAGLFCFGV